MTTKTAQNKNTIQKAVTKRGAKTTYPEIAGIAENLNIELEICGKEGRKMIEDYIIENYKGELVPVGEKPVNLSTAGSNAVEPDFNLKSGLTSTALTFNSNIQKAAMIQSELSSQSVFVTDDESFDIAKKLQNTYQSTQAMVKEALLVLKSFRIEALNNDANEIAKKVNELETMEYEAGIHIANYMHASFTRINSFHEQNGNNILRMIQGYNNSAANKPNVS